MRKSAPTKLTATATQRIRDVEDALAHYSLARDNIQASLEAMSSLLETARVMMYTLVQRPDGDDLMIGRSGITGEDPTVFLEHFNAYLEGRGIEWGGYHPVRPAPVQRDHVLNGVEIVEASGGASLAVEGLLYPKMGWKGFDTLRTLVCDGPSLLAWIGLVQEEKASDTQRELMERVVPALKRRLLFERLVSEAAFAGDATVAALEQISGAAWVLGPTGRIQHANAAGRARFDHDPEGIRSALQTASKGSGHARYKTMPIRGGSGVGHLVIELADPAMPSRGIAHVAMRFGLTPAQTRVLERVARGVSNATIAAELGVAERTVEAHVTAILVKAQVPSRAALIVRIFRDYPMS